MDSQTLERVSVSYRRGYQDGYSSRQFFHEPKLEYIKPFSDYDYTKGYSAGKNDAFWSYATKQEKYLREVENNIRCIARDVCAANSKIWEKLREVERGDHHAWYKWLEMVQS